ncbi:MAG: LysR family transcriptional regulator [Candidatus Dactylopiibacterium carminicum]|uniref:LysR family transcriptional regulator n=1 Tax=Candidatus Dactylopiibacterium carminicum TaxID=857335 RepID=A0A272EW30_9RHOO|nr:LysR family transcriptional regulator [Candidatus Dactylopiibacterium carminicum]KAF7599619.1 LysR family transcriptional regulator [Candidatus Dactylopiibacterium carminicum]PAS94266.1 MAG: LysR family transcriptional regulator [Candidatus Dactylopiibacterium carminicum]PAS98462.1 MAG: LysR family transcriptional regulator [Candidatus Dactylopiibacterium carminicum]PAS99622.1 MAG: LysR family transcriptional regulator [Candidatus Dactylopiibacterium carminicum]
MPTPRDVLTPASLALLQSIADTGSFAAAARANDMVPSALTYRVRQIEDALDVLLFDRSSRQARLTPAGTELLRGGASLLGEVDAIANRVKRVATGWEPQLTITVDSIIDRATVMELCASFLALSPPTRLRLRAETLSGTLTTLTSGEADLAIGVVMDNNTATGLQRELLGTVHFVFAVAPHHPLAQAAEPLSDELIRQHRAVAIADSVRQGSPLTIGLLSGQDVLTVADMPTKLDAQIRGLGVGLLPTCLAQDYIDVGRLVAKPLERATQQIQSSYAWRKRGQAEPGRALQWWLEQLQRPVTRAALLGERHRIR